MGIARYAAETPIRSAVMVHAAITTSAKPVLTENVRFVEAILISNVAMAVAAINLVAIDMTARNAVLTADASNAFARLVLTKSYWPVTRSMTRVLNHQQMDADQRVGVG